MKNRNIHLPSMPVVLTAVILSVFVTSAGLPLAEAAETYHGTITGGTFFCNGNQVSGPTVTGIWNLNIDAHTPAQVTLNVFYNGSHHLAFGVQRVDASVIHQRRLRVLGVRRHRHGDARYDRDSGEVLLARRTWRFLSRRVSL